MIPDFYPFYATALILLSVTIMIRRRKIGLTPLDKIVLIGTYTALILGFYYGDVLIKLIAVGILIVVIVNFESLIGKKVQKRLGKPCRITNRIQIYLSRHDLEFADIVGIAKKEIIFVSVTHEMAAKDKQDVIRDAIINNVDLIVKVFVLDPHSKYVSHKEHVFGTGIFAEGDPDLEKPLKTRIEESFNQLKYFKNSLEEKANRFLIETYDVDIPASLMIIDHDVNKKACIKIEEHFERSKELSRQNKVVFHKDNPSYYEKCYNEYLKISQPCSAAPIQI